MENIQDWEGEFIKLLEDEVETTETKVNFNSQIPFLADLIKLEQQFKKSEDDLKNEGCSSWVCKEEILHEEQNDFGQQPGAFVEDNKINLKEELCAGNWNCPVDPQDNAQEMKSQWGLQRCQPLGPDTSLTDTLSEQERNIEQIKEEIKEPENIDGNIEETAETRNMCVSVIRKGQGEHELTELALGKGVYSKLSENYSCVSEKGKNFGGRNEGSENDHKCGVASEGCTSLITHQMIDKCKKSHKCNLCGKECSSNNRLITHKKTHAREKSHDKCAVCSKVFATKYNMTVHKRIHSLEKPFTCDVCGIGCKTSSNLKVHQRTHSTEKPYKCDSCGKGFKQNGHLIVHKRVHSEEKPFKCDVCDKGFISSSNLKVHQRTHSREKPYKCDVCDKRFNEISHFKIHQRIHSEEKPYNCDVCGKGFCQKSSMIVHKRTHTGEKSYKCDVCGASFFTNSNLKVHQRRHTGEKPYKCTMCCFYFTHFPSLKKHIMSHL